MRFPTTQQSIADFMHTELAQSDILRSEARLLVQSEMLRQRLHNDAPKLIPKIIHQTYKTNRVPDKLKRLMRTWRETNPDYEIRFYDDAACKQFVATEFPEWFEAYMNLPKDVERADFFRYMVVLRYGGIYADIDTECREPVDNFLLPQDTLVVGWENEFQYDADAFSRHFVRKRQVLQWVFMGVPGHPVLRAVCNHIAKHATTTFSNNTNRDTLERTGPGIWTDAVLHQSVVQGLSRKGDNPWLVRILPRVAFGAHPSGDDGIPPTSSQILVMHHFMGSWKVQGGWQKQNLGLLLLSLMPSTMVKPAEESGGMASLEEGHPELRGHSADKAAPVAVLEPKADASRVGRHLMPDMVTDLFPVSVSWEPPFDVLVLLAGEERTLATAAGSVSPPLSPIEDVSATLTKWGIWQPGVHPTRRPGLAEALVGSLGGHRRSAVLIDVGSGLGYFSLAAAARGHHVHAFETRPSHLRALHGSLSRNGFNDLVKLHTAPLGVPSLEYCLAWQRRHGPSPKPNASAIGKEPRLFYDEEARLERGAHGDPCVLPAEIEFLDEIFGSDLDMGALRISAEGWDGWLLEGAAKIMETRPPPIVVVELRPAAMIALGWEDPKTLLDRMWEWGYTDISHSGSVCDERWHNITTGHKLQRSRSGPSLTELETALKQPTWCRLHREGFRVLVERAVVHPTLPESVLFHHQQRPDMLEQERLARLAVLERAALARIEEEKRAKELEGQIETR
ncbi:hypothetical protein CYMTET_42231 [Cymbomonas tetramitiformis]|uniref:Uncharacterized protein n=1 Tax=Cymbomonas tetramitiformis TaxID=36881 RepID=A0AAE0C4H3_9CHLO|nr:hypothetical protein CYMTET_42231 [Cymbomonas tetramitiformis]